MFNIFKTKKNNFVGIDFGTSAIKIVELSLNGKEVRLKNYGWADLEVAFRDEKKEAVKMQTHEAKLNQCVRELLERMDLKEKEAYVAIPGFSGLITLVEFPEMKADELEKAIHYESHKYIPTSVEDIAMSWEIVGKKDGTFQHEEGGAAGNTKKIQVLLVAAPKKEIFKYEKLMENSNLGIAAIELETFSIVRAVLGENRESALVVDIGSRATNIILVENGVVKVNRNIDVGGNEVTSTIAESMHISRQRAEIFKCGEKDLLNGKESPLTVPVLEMIVSEINRILIAYRQKNQDLKVDKVVLSGGLSKMKGLEEYFANALNLKVEVANPWKQIKYDEKLDASIKKMGSSFAVAIGLAMRGIEENSRE